MLRSSVVSKKKLNSKERNIFLSYLRECLTNGDMKGFSNKWNDFFSKRSIAEVFQNLSVRLKIKNKNSKKLKFSKKGSIEDFVLCLTFQLNLRLVDNKNDLIVNYIQTILNALDIHSLNKLAESLKNKSGTEKSPLIHKYKNAILTCNLKNTYWKSITHKQTLKLREIIDRTINEKERIAKNSSTDSAEDSSEDFSESTNAATVPQNSSSAYMLSAMNVPMILPTVDSTAVDANLTLPQTDLESNEDPEVVSSLIDTSAIGADIEAFLQASTSRETDFETNADLEIISHSIDELNKELEIEQQNQIRRFMYI